MISRRALFLGSAALLAAPSIVRAMPVSTRGGFGTTSREIDAPGSCWIIPEDWRAAVRLTVIDTSR